MRTNTPRSEPLTISLMTSWAAVKFHVSGFQRGTAEPKIGSTPPKAIAAMAKNGTTNRATSQIVPGRVKEAQRPWASALLPSPRATVSQP